LQTTKLERFRLNFSCCANRDVTILRTAHTDLFKSTFTPNQTVILTELQKEKKERPNLSSSVKYYFGSNSVIT